MRSGLVGSEKVGMFKKIRLSVEGADGLFLVGRIGDG